MSTECASTARSPIVNVSRESILGRKRRFNEGWMVRKGHNGVDPRGTNRAQETRCGDLYHVVIQRTPRCRTGCYPVSQLHGWALPLICNPSQCRFVALLCSDGAVGAVGGNNEGEDQCPPVEPMMITTLRAVHVGFLHCLHGDGNTRSNLGSRIVLE